MTSFPSRCWGQLKIACSLQCSADTTSQRSNRNNDPVATAAGNLPRFNAGCSSLFKRRSHGTYWEMTHTTNMCVLKFFLFRVYNLHEESPWPFKCFFTLNMKRFFCSVSSHLQKKKKKRKRIPEWFLFCFYHKRSANKWRVPEKSQSSVPSKWHFFVLQFRTVAQSY